jgi:transcriptional regulator with XRE-family HTH domain
MEETFGTRVRRLRLERGYNSPAEADRHTGVPAGTWDNVERKGTDARLGTIEAIRVALGATIEELLGGVSGPGAAQDPPIPPSDPPGDTPGPDDPRPRPRRGGQSGNGSRRRSS